MKIKFYSYMLLVLLTLSPWVVLAGNWQEDFARLCGATETADSLSVEELKGLIAECDALLEVVDKEAGKQKKLYLFRLKKCRNFYSYLVSVKEADKKE